MEAIAMGFKPIAMGKPLVTFNSKCLDAMPENRKKKSDSAGREKLWLDKI